MKVFLVKFAIKWLNQNCIVITMLILSSSFVQHNKYWPLLSSILQSTHGLHSIALCSGHSWFGGYWTQGQYFIVLTHEEDSITTIPCHFLHCNWEMSQIFKIYTMFVCFIQVFYDNHMPSINGGENTIPIAFDLEE